MGTDGFEFVEYTAPDIELLRSLFTRMGFPEVARHKSKNVTLHKQARLQLHHQCRARLLRRGICQGPWPQRLRDGLPGQGREGRARARAEARRDQRRGRKGDGELDIPAIEGIGGSRLFFVDRYGDERLDLRGRLRLPSRLAAADGATRIRSSPTSTI